MTQKTVKHFFSFRTLRMLETKFMRFKGNCQNLEDFRKNQVSYKIQQNLEIQEIWEACYLFIKTFIFLPLHGCVNGKPILFSETVFANEQLGNQFCKIHFLFLASYFARVFPLTHMFPVFLKKSYLTYAELFKYSYDRVILMTELFKSTL